MSVKRKQDQPNVIKGSRCLVTGGGGFLGSYVVDKLKERGAASVFTPRSNEVNLCNDAECRTLFSLLRPDYVFHIAAEVGGIAANKANPGRYFYANMKMTLNVIECSREFSVKKLVHTGSVSAYPAKAPMPLKEVRRLNKHIHCTHFSFIKNAGRLVGRLPRRIRMQLWDGKEGSNNDAATISSAVRIYWYPLDFDQSLRPS